MLLKILRICVKWTLCFGLVGNVGGIFAQEKKICMLGINYGTGSQSRFPFGNPNYFQENKYIKLQLNYLIRRKANWQFEMNIEPSFYVTKHQLLNLYFIQPSSGIDYLARRDRFTQLHSFNEYTLNMGIISRYYALNGLSVYAIASIGPMISGGDTERLKKGFAFSDIVGLGISYEYQRIRFDSRTSLRHASNANLSFPNEGHNGTCLEAGFSFKLRD